MYGIWAAVILAVAHLVSSFAVVAAYALANRFMDLDGLSWMHLVAGGLLVAMGLRQWFVGHTHHHGGGHSHGDGGKDEPRDLLALAGFAFALGFVHEEEFAIIALAVGKTNPWGLMAAYAGAVALSLVLLTMAAIAAMNHFESHVHRLEHALPKISAALLVAMGLAYMLKLV